MLTRIRHIILAIIDFFHWPVSRWVSAQNFRYLFCGGSNTLLNIGLYSICLRFVFTDETVRVFGHYNIAASVAAYVVAFCISFPIGFTLSRHIVFPESNLHGRIQFFRYVMATATFILLTYLLIKFFDMLLQVMPHGGSYALIHSVTYAIINVITAILSYISQRKFTFKTIEEEVVPD